MARTGRFLAVAALAALLLGACANKDADRADVVNALEEAGASSEQASCVGDGLTDEDSEFRLSQKELNDLAGASDLDELDSDVNDRVRAVMDQCLGDGSGSDTATTDSTDESTTTTGG